MTPELDVLICTYGRAGLDRTSRMRLPEVEGVRYVVSWQTAGADPSDIPAALVRRDILISPTESVGLSNNRNHAIAVAEAQVCLIADDDLDYDKERLKAVIDTFAARPDLDLATFRYEGSDEKFYYESERDLTSRLPKNYYVTSFEIAFRRCAVQNKIFFNRHFGINSLRFGSGEEGIFLHDCRTQGLNCRYFPVTITRHPGLTTGNRPLTTKPLAQAEGAYVRYVYGLRGWPRVPLIAWRRYKARQMKLFWGLWHVMRGFLIKVPRETGL